VLIEEHFASQRDHFGGVMHGERDQLVVLVTCDASGHRAELTSRLGRAVDVRLVPHSVGELEELEAAVVHLASELRIDPVSVGIDYATSRVDVAVETAQQQAALGAAAAGRPVSVLVDSVEPT
jgi:hypothetical protein